MEIEARPTLYDRKLQEELVSMEERLSKMLETLDPVHADKAVAVLQSLNRLRRDMKFS